jgi:hypothetical protein
VGTIVGCMSVIGAAVGTLAGAVAMLSGRLIRWADWIGIGSGLGALAGFSAVIGILLSAD